MLCNVKIPLAEIRESDKADFDISILEFVYITLIFKMTGVIIIKEFFDIYIVSFAFVYKERGQWRERKLLKRTI